MRKISLRFMMVGIVAAGLCLATVAMGEVANRYAGQVILFSKRPPSQWANDSVFVRFVNRHKTARIQQEEDGDWRVEYMGFFRRPVNDREVSVLFYDANSASDRYITSYTLYLQDTRQRLVGGVARLEKRDFAPNKYYKITISSRGKVLAALNKFALIGEEPKRSGKVNFTLEETRGRK